MHLVFVLTGRYSDRMAKGKRIHPTRKRLLDAAEEIVANQGVLSLTFDRIAEQANVAKGTVLYHFDSKETLTAAMIERFVERFDTAWADSIRSDPDPRGRNIRAYITATHRGEPFTGRYFDDVNGAITAALANSPAKLRAVQAHGQRHQKAIESDSVDPVFATIIRLAIDGLWFAESFKLMRYDPKLKAAVVNRLTEWSRGEASLVENLASEAVSRNAKKTHNGRSK